MRWLIVMAGVIAFLPAAIAAFSMQQRMYLRWVSGWVGHHPHAHSAVGSEAEGLLTEALPGSVVGFMESQFSGDGNVALVESGVRLTQWPDLQKTAWGAFWHDVTGYVVLRENGAVRIEVSGHGYVLVETGRGAVQDHWESVLLTKGVPLSGS